MILLRLFKNTWLVWHSYILIYFNTNLKNIKAQLKKNGYDVRILDCFAENPEETVQGDTVRAGMTDDEIIDYIHDFDPHLVGVSQMFSYLEPVCKSIFKLV